MKITEFKEGDIVAHFDSQGGGVISIFKKIRDDYTFSAYASYITFLKELRFNDFSEYVWAERLATEEEKKWFMYLLHEAKKDWDSKNRKIIDLKISPILGDVVYIPNILSEELYSGIIWNNSKEQKIMLDRKIVHYTIDRAIYQAKHMLKND